MKNTIENIAKVLITNKISFTYDKDYLRVTDSKIQYELFEVACYHSDTKKLVLMTVDYTKTISIEDFINYFNKPTKK